MQFDLCMCCNMLPAYQCFNLDWIAHWSSEIKHTHKKQLVRKKTEETCSQIDGFWGIKTWKECLNGFYCSQKFTEIENQHTPLTSWKSKVVYSLHCIALDCVSKYVSCFLCKVCLQQLDQDKLKLISIKFSLFDRS